MGWDFDISGRSEANCNVTCPEVKYECPTPVIPEFKCPEFVCPKLEIPTLTCGDINRGEIICSEIHCPQMKCESMVCPEIKWPEIKCPSIEPKENLNYNCPQIPDVMFCLFILIAR